jgi:uncharacterized LabA/DUF88 family protein
VIHHDNGIDFAFIDADNIHDSISRFAKVKGLDSSEIDLIRFEHVIGNGASKDGWIPHTRRFVYYADDNGKTPPWLEKTEESNGFILRNGQLTHKKGGRQRKQQGVDVLLAVEAMQHSFRKSMTHCTIYAADGDYLPLVDELVANGTFVRIKAFNDPSQGDVAPSLRRSADSYERMGVWDLYRGLPDNLKSFGSDWLQKGALSKRVSEELSFHGREAFIADSQGNFELLFEQGNTDQYRRLSFTSRLGCMLMLKLGLHTIPPQEWEDFRTDGNYRL